MSKKSGLTDLVGRKIATVTVKESEKPPHVQLFVTFDDGRYFEVVADEDGNPLQTVATEERDLIE